MGLGRIGGRVRIFVAVGLRVGFVLCIIKNPLDTSGGACLVLCWAWWALNLEQPEIDSAFSETGKPTH